MHNVVRKWVISDQIEIQVEEKDGEYLYIGQHYDVGIVNNERELNTLINALREVAEELGWEVAEELGEDAERVMK